MKFQNLFNKKSAVNQLKYFPSRKIWEEVILRKGYKLALGRTEQYIRFNSTVNKNSDSFVIVKNRCSTMPLRNFYSPSCSLITA
jgi:hypothetical protein